MSDHQGVGDVQQMLRHALADRYVVDRELGHGGMATVFAARDLRHGRWVAIKVLAPEVTSAIAADRFRREVEIAASLSHPNIVPVHDSGEVDGLAYLVMPLVEGESLRARLARERQLDLDAALAITCEVGDALAHAHARNVVHRDIKPENILFQDGHALVADFGVALALDERARQRLTASGIGVGTPEYMSPEQMSGEHDIDARADQYALAMVLYEMLGGEPPFASATPQGSLARKIQGELLALRTLRPSVPDALDAVVRRALAPAPVDRYPDVGTFIDALRAARAGRRALSTPARVGILAAAILAVAALVLVVARGGLRVAPSDTRLGVAIFPFRVSGANAADWAEAIPDLLATALDGTPALRVADPWSLWRSLRVPRNAPARSPDPDEAAALARRVGAGRYLLGSVVRDGKRLDLTLRIYQRGSDAPMHTLTESAPEDSLTPLVHRVAVAVITSLGDADVARASVSAAAYATQSSDAMKAYLAARAALRRGMVDSAEIFIDRALALDSTFAIAMVEAAHIKSWAQYVRNQPYAGLRELIERSLRHGDSMSARNRQRALAMKYAIETDGLRSSEAARRLVELDPTDFDGWMHLSYSHMVYGWQYGATARDALDAADHAVRLDSTNVLAVWRRAWLAMVAGEDVAPHIRRLEASDTSSDFARGALMSLRAFAADDPTFAAMLDSLAAATPTQWIALVRNLRATRPDRAHALVRQLLARAGPGLPRQLATAAYVQLAVASGAMTEADSIVRSGAFAPRPAAMRVHAVVAVTGFARTADPAAAAHAVDSLAAFVPIDSAMAFWDSRPVWATAWLVAAHHAAFGDTAAAHRWQALIRRFPSGGTVGDYVGAIASDVDSRLAERRGDMAGALAGAERAMALWTVHTDNMLESQPEPNFRLHLAQLLQATGHPDSAAVMYRSLVPPANFAGPLTARSWLELGTLEQGRGDCAAATRHLGLARELWAWSAGTAATDSLSRRAQAAEERCRGAR